MQTGRRADETKIWHVCFFTKTCSLIWNREKEPKKPNKLGWSFLCLQLARDITPPTKGEDLNLYLRHHFPYASERAQCPHGGMLHSSAVRHRRDIMAQIRSHCSATDVTFSFQLWLQSGKPQWKYRKASQSKRAPIYKFMQSSSSPVQFLSPLSCCPCSHQSLCMPSQRPKSLFLLPAVNPSDSYNNTWFFLLPPSLG